MKSGIYIIKNVKNDKKYIGSAINLNGRWNEHKSRLRKNKHPNLILQNVYNKHGIEILEFSVLEFINDKEDLILREQHYLDLWNPEYNICKIAGSTLGVACSDEAREKISIANSGKVRSEETKKNISESKLGKKRGPFSKEWKQNISDSISGIKRSQETRRKNREARIRFLERAK